MNFAIQNLSVAEIAKMDSFTIVKWRGEVKYRIVKGWKPVTKKTPPVSLYPGAEVQVGGVRCLLVVRNLQHARIKHLFETSI